MPGALKLDYLQPIKPILFPKFLNFFTFILGSSFLLPQRANPLCASKASGTILPLDGATDLVNFLRFTVTIS